MGEGWWCPGTGAGTLADRAARAAEVAALETLVKGLGVEMRPTARWASKSTDVQDTALTLQVPSQCGDTPLLSTCTLPEM